MNLFHFTLFIFFATLVSPFCSRADDSTPISIAAMLHLTGDYAMEGKAFLEGMELRVDEVNALGGINNRKLKLVVEDTAYDAKTVLTIANKLSGNEEILGVLISTLHEIKSCYKIFEKSSLPAVVLWDSTPEIESMRDSIFAIGPWAPDTGEKASRFATNTLKARTAAIISNQHEWGLTVANFFKNDFEKRGGVIVSQEILNSDTHDFKSILLKIKAKNPRVIYAPLNFNMVAFAKQIKQLGISAPIIMSDNITESLIDSSNGAFENFYHTAVADPDGTEVEKLRALYLKKYAQFPKLVLFTAWGYDGVRILEQTLKNGTETRKEVRDNIYKISNLPGVSGNIHFSSAGSSPMHISLFQVKNNKFIKIEGPDIQN